MKHTVHEDHEHETGLAMLTKQRAADFPRFETVFFPLPRLSPLRPGIFSVSGIFLASEVFFPLQLGFFPLRQNVFFVASEKIFPASKRIFFRAERYCLRFRYFSRFPKVFFPLRRVCEEVFFRFGAESAAPVCVADAVLSY